MFNWDADEVNSIGKVISLIFKMFQEKNSKKSVFLGIFKLN